MNAEDFPRVLVVGGTPFGALNGTGITLANLFDGWPRDRLGQVYAVAAEPDDLAASFRVPARAYPVDAVFRRLLTPGGHRIVRGAAPIAAVGPTGDRRWSKAAVHRELRAVADLSLAVHPGGLRRFVADFRPDLVYSLLGSVRMLRLADRVARHARTVLVPHFADDWPSTLYRGGELLGFARRSVDTALADVWRRAPLGLCISTPMASEFAQRYGLPFTAFANCVDDKSFLEPSPAQHTGPVNLVYLGGLHLGRADLLRDIGAALSIVEGARLTVHAPPADLAEHGPALASVPAIRLGGCANGTDVPPALAAADILVHVESFADDLSRYTRLSLSTKVPQYLAAGRAVFGYGPAGLASMRHLRSAGAGVVVGRKDPADLADGLRRLCGDAALRARLARDGHRYALRHHRKDEVAARFARTLAAAAGAPFPASPSLEA